MSDANWYGLDRIIARLDRAAHIDRADFDVLGDRVSRIVIEGNRKGVLSGLDKDGLPLKPVTYRTGRAKATKARKAAFFGTTDAGSFKGFGPLASGLHGNLTRKEYEKLTGPPLAPRGAGSRVITNFGEVDPREHVSKGMTLEWTWQDVVSVKGFPFLSAHFKGLGRLPVRDLAGIRPTDRREIHQASAQWLAWLLGGTT